LILVTDALAAAEVGVATLMQRHDQVHAAAEQFSDDEIRAKIGVGEQHIAGVEVVVQLPQQGGFAGALAPIGAVGGALDGADGQ
jgi:hypothetical protein